MTRFALLLAALALGGPACMKLDGFLFAPTQAPASANLMEAATAIPATQVRELTSELVASDGVTVNAYYLSHTTVDGTNVARQNQAILYCHGNSANIASYALRAQILWQQGYNVLVFDYRGFGKTPGKPSEPGVYADARAARDWLVNTAGFNPTSVAFYGWSLGAAVATEMAVEYQTPALLLEAPFASVAEIIGDSAGLVVPRPWFADAMFDNRGKIPAFAGDLLVMHGSKDHYIMPKYGEEIAAAAQGHAATVTLWLVPGADHDTVPCVNVGDVALANGGCSGGFSNAYLTQVTDFFDASLH